VEPGATAPSSRAPVVRWGLGDFAWLWPAGIVAALTGATVGIAITGDKVGDIGALTAGLSFAGQFLVWGAGLVAISRTKGRGSLEADFGLVPHARHAWGLLVGLGLQIALSALVLPLVSLAHDEDQQVVEQLKRAGGLKLLVLVVAAGFLAPVFEELMFRGLLLRSLQRRFSPAVAIAVSALTFALAHPLLDGRLGTLATVPALYALGAISATAAVWTGDLSLSITLHVGFNLLTIALVL
jgi:membrane protease YdiL (CAAX protease family)